MEVENKVKETKNRVALNSGRLFIHGIVCGKDTNFIYFLKGKWRAEVFSARDIATDLN